MLKSFRFLLQFTWVNMATLVGFAAVVVAGAYATGVPTSPSARDGNLFQTYLSSFLVVILLVLFLFAFGLCSSNLNLALSMGARRSDFFWAIQGSLLAYAALGWVLQLFLSALTRLGNWTNLSYWEAVLTLGPVWLFPLLCLVAGIWGCVCGLVFTRSKVWGTILMSVVILLAIVGMVVLMLNASLGMWAFLMDTSWAGIWRALPVLLLTAGVLLTVGCEAVIWRTVRRYVVR